MLDKFQSKTILTLLSLLSILFSFPALAAETAKTLPEKISRFRLVGVNVSPVTEKFNRDGLLETFTAALNRSITIKDYVSKEPRLGILVNALNAMDPGLGDQLLATNLYADFSLEANQYVAAYEYGATSRLSIGIRIPVVKRRVKASLRASTVNNAEYMAAQVGKLSPDVSQGIYDLGSKRFDTAFFEESLFTSKGYEAPYDFEKTQLGDIEMGTKYNLLNHGPFLLSSQIGVRLPTGATPSLTNIYDNGSGDGAWAVGTSFYQELNVNPYLTLGGMQKFGYFVPDTRQRAVPKSPFDSLPSLLPKDGQVQDVKRKQPLQFDTEVSSNLIFGQSGWSSWSALQYSAQGKSSFSGGGNLYYDGLREKTGYRKTAMEVGLGYSTIGAFRRKEFPVPMDVEALYNFTINGHNTPLASYARADLKVYF